MTPTFLQLATGCSFGRAELFAPLLAEACSLYHITTPKRLAAFLAQVAHESGSLVYVREIALGDAYEGRDDLGNTQPGDGTRYRGRGLIQITGRANYQAAYQRMQSLDAPDFEAFPVALEEPRWAALSAADWWAAHDLNALADRGEFVKIGRAINRGNAEDTRPANGEADRLERWERAKAALASHAPADDPIKPAPIPTQPPAPAAPPEPAIPAGEATEFEPQQEPEAVMPGSVPSPVSTPAAAHPQPEKTMPLPAIIVSDLVRGLAGTVIDAFSPIARRELARHTDPAVADQVASGIVETLKAATGQRDPVAAVVAAKADPKMIQQAEQSALDTLDRLAPMLEQAQQWERAARADSEASMAAAANRPNPQDAYLTRAIVQMMAALLILLTGGLVALLVLGKMAEATAVIGIVGPLVGMVARDFSTRYRSAYGSGEGSATSNVVIATAADAMRGKK